MSKCIPGCTHESHVYSEGILKFTQKCNFISECMWSYLEMVLHFQVKFLMHPVMNFHFCVFWKYFRK